jgi:hypothetical protein
MKSAGRISPFEWAGIIALHVLVLFVILNVGIWAVSKIKSVTAANTVKKVPYKHKGFDPSLAPMYPDLAPQDINQLMSDSRRISQEYESYTQFREVAPYRSKFVNVDEHGIRLSKDQGPWPPSPDHFNVFFFGGSTAFGYGLPDQQTVPSFLQDLLRNEGGLRAAIYNFGRASYFSPQERVLFEKLVHGGFVPDMAVFLDGSNEFVFWDHEPGYTARLKKWLPDGDVPITRQILEQLPVTKMVRGWLGVEDRPQIVTEDARGKPAKEEIQRWLNDTLDRYLRNKRMIEAVSRELHVTPVFVWQPSPLHKYDQKYHLFANFDYDGFTPLVRPGFELMGQSWKTRPLGSNFIWCADIAESHHEPLYVSAFHYSPKMAEMVARCIFRGLVEGSLLSAQLRTRSQ